jgi:hypothetical protein
VKILSIRQPWASLITHGLKDVENRTWSTKYRGLVLIHASQNEDKISSDELQRRFGVNAPKLRPTGGVIGVVDIVDCVDHHDSKWFDGDRFGFVLKNPRPFRFVRAGRVNSVCARRRAGCLRKSRELLPNSSRTWAGFKPHLG